MSKIKINQDRAISNLPIVPSPDVDNGLNRVYLTDVKIYDKEIEIEKKSGELNNSMFAGKERPYLAFYFVKTGNEKGEDRDLVHIHRYYPVDNVKSDGSELSKDIQFKAFNGMVDSIIHIFNAFRGPLAKNTRPLKEFELDADLLLSDDADIRIEQFKSFFTTIESNFNGIKEEKATYVSTSTTTGVTYVPLWLKIVISLDGTRFEIPRYVNKGFIEPIRFNGKDIVKAQIFIDPIYDNIIIKEKKKSGKSNSEENTSAATKIAADLNLD